MSLWEAGYGINCSIYFALTVIDNEIIPKKLFGLADFSRAKAFDIKNTPKVIMIGEDKNFVFTIF